MCNCKRQNNDQLNSSTRLPSCKKLIISAKSKNRLIEATKCINYRVYNKDYEEFIAQSLQAVCSSLSTDEVKTIRDMKTARCDQNYLFLDNLPIDLELPPTPNSGLRSDMNKTTFIAESVLIGISALLGEPIGLENEKEGSLVHDIIPVINTKSQLSNEGSKKDFGLHVENATFEQRESFLTLLGLRQDREQLATTPVVTVSDILKHLQPQHLYELTKEQFYIRRPYILDKAETRLYSNPTAIFNGPLENPEVRATLYDEGTISVTDKGQVALEAFKAIANKIATPLKIKPGQMVIINNKNTLHGRSAFKAYGDGKDRHLLRSYIVDSLWQFRSQQANYTRILKR